MKEKHLYTEAVVGDFFYFELESSCATVHNFIGNDL